MAFTSKFMDATTEDKVQFIILQYKCIGHFDLSFDHFIFYGFRGENEYSGFNRLFVYDIYHKEVIFDDYYLKDTDLEKTLKKIFDIGGNL